MLRTWVLCFLLGGLLAWGAALGAPVSFTLLTHADNVGWLPQQQGVLGVSGDHLIQTSDDISGPAFNPEGCFTFGFMNPIGLWPPDYPPGYAEGIHSMAGTIELDVDLAAGGAVAVNGLTFQGVAYPGRRGRNSFQYLVQLGDPATDGSHGPVDGIGNTGVFSASDSLGWSLELSLDLYKDLPFAGAGGIDMTFNDWEWTGFLIPGNRLDAAAMGFVELDDPLGYFGGASEDFEAWLIEQVAPRLPDQATWLLFAQAEGKPDWNNPGMRGWDPQEGIFAETIVAYATVPYQPPAVIPEPSVASLLLGGLAVVALRRRRRH